MAESLADELDDAAVHFGLLARHGPDLRINAHKMAAKEAVEFSETPTLEEAADVLICVVVALYYKGHDVDDLAEAIHQKMIINKKRSWTEQEDGTWQHV